MPESAKKLGIVWLEVIRPRILNILQSFQAELLNGPDSPFFIKFTGTAIDSSNLIIRYFKSIGYNMGR